MSNVSADIYVEDRVDEEEALLLDPKSLDPDTYYRWVQLRPQNIARKKAQGFQITSRTKSGVKPLVELEKTADDSIRFADSVLMSCPKSKYLSRRQAKKQVVQARLEATSQRFREKVEQARSQGLPVEITEKIQDKGEMEDEE